MLEYNFPVIYKQMNYDFSFVGSIEPEIADLIRSGRKTFVTNMSEPVLIEEGYKGYNIVKFGKKYYGLAQEIGEIDFMQISQKALSCYCDLGKCFIESSIPAVKEKVNFVVINGIKAGKNHRE